MKHLRLALALLTGATLCGAAQAQTTNGGLIASSTSQNIVKVVPLTAGQLLIGQGTLVDPAATTMSGDATITGGGVLTVTKTNGVSLGTSATVNTGTNGATIPVLNGANIFGPTLQTFTGHVAANSTSPTLSSCGTSPAIVGDDKDGQVTMGTGTPAGCTITFASAYIAVPMCVVTWQANPLATQSYSITNTALTLTQTATSSNKVNYHCTAQNGG